MAVYILFIDERQQFRGNDATEQCAVGRCQPPQTSSKEKRTALKHKDADREKKRRSKSTTM